MHPSTLKCAVQFEIGRQHDEIGRDGRDWTSACKDCKGAYGSRSVHSTLLRALSHSFSLKIRGERTQNRFLRKRETARRIVYRRQITPAKS